MDDAGGVGALGCEGTEPQGTQPGGAVFEKMAAGGVLPVLVLQFCQGMEEVHGKVGGGRGRRAAVGGQRSAGRGQRSAVSGQRSEVSGQRAEVRVQRSECMVVIW